MSGLDLTSLGFSNPSQTRIIVAMSGGVDSSVTAALLHEAGFNVIGITLQLYDYGMSLGKKGACCAGQDIYDASLVAEKFGFPHYVLDYESVFKESVIEDFADSYLRGETPIPCVRCNQRVKFRDLFKVAKDLGGHALATGHYVERRLGQHGPELHRAQNSKKDQSYFLFATTTDQLDYLRFPLGHMTKEETRLHAYRLGLNVADKPDSQDICFVPNGNYAQVVEKLRPGALESGEILDEAGHVLGKHSGIINFTIGQRKGLNLSSNPNNGEPLYVIRLNPEKHQVIVGPQSSLAKKEIYLNDVNWLSQSPADTSISCHVKVRSSQEPLPATAFLNLGEKTAQITFETPEFGISAGQACVFYKNSQVLGGGWISR
ncbi:MAG: tRNA 2-thiouridine(34) synthase MnmA [Proteobacteria bacterium]|nr:tRNA 2-thiouridine(34) synthase MnmA [Pseudomonadota bacterium]